MFALFFSLYASLFTGSWMGIINTNQLEQKLTPIFHELGTFFTSIFGDVQYNKLGNYLLTYDTNIDPNYISMPNYLILTAFILALITSIGIVVITIKGVKKAFNIFFGQIR